LFDELIISLAIRLIRCHSKCPILNFRRMYRRSQVD